MHFVLSGSAEYLSYAPVLLRSVVNSNPDSELVFHVFHFLSDDNISRLRKKIDQACDPNPNAMVLYYSVSLEQIKDIDSSKGWNPALWARWKALDTLRDKTDRFLVLGIDTLVKKNISDFYFQDLEGYVFCASPDCWVSTADLSNWPPYEELKARNILPSRYINADVVLVNLSARNSPTFSDFVRAYAGMNSRCLDQDVINYCYTSSLKLAPASYNHFPNIFSDFNEDRTKYECSHIAQFAGAPKPWNVLSLKTYSYIGHLDWWRIAHELGIKRRHFIINRLHSKFKKLLEKAL